MPLFLPELFAILIEPILSFEVNSSERISFLRRKNFTAPYAPFAIWWTPYTEARQIKGARGKILSNSLAVSDSVDRRAFQRFISRTYGRDKIHLRAFPSCRLNERTSSGIITR